MKKIFALIMVLALIMGVCASAYAEGGLTVTAPNGAPALALATMAAENRDNYTYVAADTIAAAFADEKADFITIHMPLTPELKEFMNADSFAKMKDGVIIINAARGELVKTSDIKVAIENGKVRCYVVDFPDSDCLNCKNIVPTPHLGASTEEAEDNCAVMAAEELKEYLEKGNVINSVNFPNLKVEMTKKHRATVISEDKGAGLVDGAVENAKGGIRYSILDSDDKIDIEALKKLDGVIAVREIC